ncbi:MAG: hypothetical protein AAGA37_10320 [Actinomycetota bacterium]
MTSEPVVVLVVHAFDCGVEASKALTTSQQPAPKWRFIDLFSIFTAVARAGERMADGAADQQRAAAAESAEAFAMALADLAEGHPHPTLLAAVEPSSSWKERIWRSGDSDTCLDEIKAALAVVTSWKQQLDLGRALPPIDPSS